VTPALELSGITKRFGPVHALRGADFSLAAGEVHALLGENGAGKSTLMHIAGGLIRADAGTISVRGRMLALRSPREARMAGIGLVHQHFTAIPALSVAENIALAAGWRVGRAPDLAARVRTLGERMGLVLDPMARTGDLTVGARQRLEILKVLAADASVLLLDEPTAVLAPSEADEVLRRVRALSAGGAAAVLITHKLDEALAAADRVTVLRAGRVVLSGAAVSQTAAGLAAAMIGEADHVMAARRVPGPQPAGPPRVSCRNLSLEREDGRGLAIRGADLVLAAGEVVGVAAVEGSGQRELLRAIAGLRPPVGGTLETVGPVAFIPEDRTTEGLIDELSVVENVVLGLGREAPWVGLAGRMDWPIARRCTAALIARHGIRADGVGAPAASLSGGNQQKLVIARALERGPRVIVAENPTRGLDVHAARNVWDALARAAAEGAAVLAWSSDLDELMAESGRLMIVARGELREPSPGADRNAVGALMLGGAAGLR
jgi:general nucleoside transport system ATP-binding protein